MATEPEPEPALPFSLVSVVEDVIQKHGSSLSDINLATRKAQEASSRRNGAATWLRNTVGNVGGKEMVDEPSEQDFRIALRSGIILCNALNKIQPGAVPKVVEAPSDIDNIPDGAALSVYQYFENVRNFLVTVEEMGLPTFEASDLEEGGQCSRIVNCVLALQSYSEWKMGGKNGLWKYGGNPKPRSFEKPVVRKRSEPFTRSLSRAKSIGDKDSSPGDHSFNIDAVLPDPSEGSSIPSVYSLIREILHDKKQEEIPIIMESLLSKVMEEFESRVLTIQQQTSITPREDKAPSKALNSNLKVVDGDEEVKNDDVDGVKHNGSEESSSQLLKHQNCQNIIQRQNENIQELKMIVHQTKEGMHCLHKKYREDFVYLAKHLNSLASSASGYQKVLEENRKLYNQMQDLKGNIRVYCRVRPLKGQPNNRGIVGNVEEESLSLIMPSKNGKEAKKIFTFNKVFGPSATQVEVFSDIQPLIRSVLDGFNVCIFAYGQTGSGKTHTMSGPDNISEDTVGVNYRALRDLFNLSEQRKDTIHYDISVQMLEIYNEQVRDLLMIDASNKRLEIRNSSHNGINVPDANLVPVSSTADVLNLMNLGQRNRAVSATAMNNQSSRSHSCLTVHVQGRELTSGNSLRGCIHLVDLAGSERVDKSEVIGDRLKEAQHINKSLSALGDVIASLAQKQPHVPYRNSKLTQLLQDSLGGQAKTLMFVHISPEPEALGETISTLKFAERVSTVELGAARVNKSSSEVKELKEQIASLQATLARMKDGELDNFKHPANSITDMTRSTSQLSFLAPTSWTSGARKLPRDDSNSIEDPKKAASKLKIQSLDPEDIYMNLPTWPHPHAGVHGNEDDRESVSCRSMNRDKSFTTDDSLTGQSEIESKHSPLLSPSYLSDPSKICMEVATTPTNDYDELELATSECSESDMSWQSHSSKTTAISNALVSRPKKSVHLKQAKNFETRSMLPSLTPSSPRKQPTLVSQPRKHSGSVSAKRRSGNAK
ncbi:kinesin-like protein KIN-14I isoform X1 [Vicia villosa]|uniref:kinesin-like protein KIN-14I isoform X1 n=2 Tax=Vicia villosa TaxID=3911 RepID=UPI00273C276D|nr:kinesin-like protein KIN-14I isoform X1 [Vicia villosa]